MTDKLKNALTRKIGPFAAWIWFAIAGGALYFYRRHSGGGSSGGSGPTLTYTGPYGQDAYGIQGGAGTGPGNSGDGTNNNNGPPVINITPPTTEAPPTAPGSDNGKNGKPRGQKPHPKHKVGSPAGPHGAIVAPSGSKPPPPKKGYTTIGTGKGGWIYKPVQNPRSHPNAVKQQARPKTTGRKNPKTRQRGAH